MFNSWKSGFIKTIIHVRLKIQILRKSKPAIHHAFVTVKLFPENVRMGIHVEHNHDKTVIFLNPN